MDQKNYTVTELMHNQSFRRLVIGTAASHEIEKWDSWIEESDQNRINARSAISEIAGFEFGDPDISDIEQKWSDLIAKIEEEESYLHYKNSSGNKSSNESKLRWIFRAAAVFLVLSMVGLGSYYFPDYEEDVSVIHLEQLSEEKTITTTGDEQKTLRFSNGSRVVLKGDSKITYSIGLLHDQIINVTLEGEAWFDVESNLSKEQSVFAVTTPDGIIRDIGTEFLVTVQKGQSRVVLQEGLVEIGSVDKEGSQNEEVRFSVKKGQMVEFNRNNILRNEKVNSTFYTSWATGFIQFDQTELQDFAEYVEQRFDVKVQINDQYLSSGITLDGAVYFKSLEGLIRSISDVTSIPVYQSDNSLTVYIGNPNE